MTGTGLLTARCDPYGAESEIILFGRVYPESMKGRYNWYCDQRGEGAFRLICTGGEYGSRRAPDGGMVPAYQCDGGHRGIPFPLCPNHQREFSTYGYAKPRALHSVAYDSNGHEQHWAPGSVVGGSKANEACPRCLFPPDTAARELNERAGHLTGQIGLYMQLGMELASPVLRMRQELDGVRARLDELHLTGRVHKCPLKLIEVS